tara:strand:- start:52185 stop:53075 length:891 start_codon:yes stop_codon:yes gene_type:complete
MKHIKLFEQFKKFESLNESSEIYPKSKPIRFKNGLVLKEGEELEVEVDGEIIDVFEYLKDNEYIPLGKQALVKEFISPNGEYMILKNGIIKGRKNIKVTSKLSSGYIILDDLSEIVVLRQGFTGVNPPGVHTKNPNYITVMSDDMKPRFFDTETGEFISSESVEDIEDILDAVDDGFGYIEDTQIFGVKNFEKYIKELDNNLKKYGFKPGFLTPDNILNKLSTNPNEVAIALLHKFMDEDYSVEDVFDALGIKRKSDKSDIKTFLNHKLISPFYNEYKDGIDYMIKSNHHDYNRNK